MRPEEETKPPIALPHAPLFVYNEHDGMAGDSHAVAACSRMGTGTTVRHRRTLQKTSAHPAMERACIPKAAGVERTSTFYTMYFVLLTPLTLPSASEVGARADLSKTELSAVDY